MRANYRRVVPGSSENSMVYHRIIGSEYGTQMPPTGALKPEQVALIKAWIDQGADWPDALANEADLPPADPKAISLIESLRTGETAAFMKAVTAEPKLLNARGPEGSTPFMYAVLYTDAATLAQLLKLGADPNKRNDANATALMWGARNLEKTRVLIDHGADVNAKSDSKRTPLIVAARSASGAPIVKLLLDHKADPNPNTKPTSESSPLLEALIAGNFETVALLVQHGADVKAAGDQGPALAVVAKCEKCLSLLTPKITDKGAWTAALVETANFGDTKAMRLMLDHGADVNAVDPVGRTALMYAVVAANPALDAVKLLIDRGANVNAHDAHKNAGDEGLTVLDIAKRVGNPAVVQLLTKAGAKASPEVPVSLKPRQGNSIHSAIQASLPLLQRGDAGFSAKAGCFSCHNNSMTAMAVGLARAHGFRVDEKIASAQVKVTADSLQKSRDDLHQGFQSPVGDNFGDFVFGYLLAGLNAQGYKPDLNTDAAVLYILSRQSANGSWPYPQADSRPPICENYITQTAIALRAVQVYAPPPAKAEADKAIALATGWLATAKSANNEDRAWRAMGLAWASSNKPALQKAMHELLAAQRPDGGWAELPTMESTAFSTGESLVALQSAGLPVSDPAYRRGVKYLLSTQQEDGSWYVKTRALAFQPWFDAGFPHGHDQWMSSAGTNWATMALTLADTAPSVTASLR